MFLLLGAIWGSSFMWIKIAIQEIGPMTLAAVRAFQRSVGMIPDGYASLDLLQRLN